MRTKQWLLAAAVVLAGQVGARAESVDQVLKQPDAWYQSDQGKQTVHNIITWQNDNGGWWKAYDPAEPRNDHQHDGAWTGPEGDDDSVWHRTSTIDNKATYTELRILAKAYTQTHVDADRAAFDRGLNYLLEAQYDNGGWPQRYPLQDNYGRHITYNDNAMYGVMLLMRDIAAGQDEFAFTTPQQRQAAQQAYDRGIQCILDTQIKIDGKLTAWCQQHDEKTLAPAGARAYELPSICTAESANLLKLLMEQDHPSDRVKQAIESAVAWFDSAKITGKRAEVLTGEQYEGGRDRVVVDDPSAPPIWARFYDLETGKPYFCGRDGVKKGTLAEIPRERRVGYAWFNNSGEKVAKWYEAWKKKQGASHG